MRVPPLENSDKATEVNM